MLKKSRDTRDLPFVFNIARTQALSVIRTLGRNPLGSDPIFSDEVNT